MCFPYIVYLLFSILYLIREAYLKKNFWLVAGILWGGKV